MGYLSHSHLHARTAPLQHAAAFTAPPFPHLTRTAGYSLPRTAITRCYAALLPACAAGTAARCATTVPHHHRLPAYLLPVTFR